MAPKPIGQFLKQARCKCGLTQRDVERMSGGGVSNGYLCQLETDPARIPSPQILRVLSDIYSVPYFELLYHAGYVTARELSSIGQLKKAI